MNPAISDFRDPSNAGVQFGHNEPIEERNVRRRAAGLEPLEGR